MNSLALTLLFGLVVFCLIVLRILDTLDRIAKRRGAHE